MVRRRRYYGALRVVEKDDQQLEDEPSHEDAASSRATDNWHYSSTEDLQVKFI
jgi:hypothetical protein